MDIFSHIKAILGMVLGLSIALLLKGSAKQIQHPGRDKPYWVHSLWAFYIFLLLIHFWWWEFYLHDIQHWLFMQYFFVILYIMVFYSICALLYPDDLKEYSDYKDYFYSRRNWLYSILAFSFVMDFVDTLIKGQVYTHRYNIEYPIRNASHIVLCLIAIKIKNRAYHSALIIVFIVYECSYILRNFWSV